MMRCEFNIDGQCIHDTGIERVACGTCPYSFEEGACRCAMFAPHEPNSKLSYIEKRASWDDVAAKGRAIVATDGVEIIKDDAQEVEAWVMSGQLEGELNDLGRPIDITDGGPYDVILSKKSWQNKSNVGGWIQGFLCDCVWGSYHSGSPGDSPNWVRFCSHAYALMLYKNMRARKDFMGASVIDRENFIKDACAGKNVGDVEDRGNYQIVRNGDKVAIRIKNANADFYMDSLLGFSLDNGDEYDITVMAWRPDQDGDYRVRVSGEKSLLVYPDGSFYVDGEGYDMTIQGALDTALWQAGIELDCDVYKLVDIIDDDIHGQLVAKKGNKEMYRWYRYAQEASDDPIEREFEALMERLRDAQGQDTLVEELQDICNDPKDYALLCAGFGNGEFAENMFSTSDTTLPVKLLYPTQNEIGLGNSLDFMLTGKSNVSMYFDSPVTIVAPIITFDNRFIIDGHHRWSQLYMINPEAEITAINFDGNVTAGQVLRDMQGAIAATHGEVPQSFADVKNVYRMSEDEIAAHIYDTIVDSAVDDMWEYADLIELYPFNTDEDGEVPFEHKLDAVVDYLTDNALKLKGNNAPYSGAADRKDMPQTDSESVNELEQGATDI